MVILTGRVVCFSLALVALLGLGVVSAGEAQSEAGGERVAVWEKKAAEAKDPVLVWIEAAKDKGEAVRLEAANQLYKAEDPRAIPVLTELAGIKPQIVEREGPLYAFDASARRALQKTTAKVEWQKIVEGNPGVKERLQAAAKAYQTDNSYLKSRIRAFISELWNEDATTLLLSADDYDTKVCAAMAEHIKVGRQLYQNALKAISKAAGPFTGTTEEAEAKRKALWGALITLRHLGDADCAPELLKVLVLDEKVDPDCDLRMQVRQTLASFGEAALPPLEDFLKREGTKPDERNTAVTAVGLIGGRRALEIIKGAATRESDPDMRKNMQAILDRLVADMEEKKKQP